VCSSDLGRATAGTGAAEELSVGTALSVSGGTLAVTTVPAANGGTGANTLTGVVKGNGTSPMTAGAVELASEVSGTLPAANGGTGLTSPGTSGNVLTSDGTTWTSAAGAASKYDLIATVNASAASTIDFTDLSSDYIAYQLFVSNLFASVSTNTPSIRTSSNNGATYNSAAGNYAYNRLFINNSGTVTGSSATATEIPFGIINDSVYGQNLTLTLVNAGVSSPAAIEWTLGTYITSGYQYRGIGFRVSTTPINAFRIFPSSGTLTGTFKLYGVKA
jgi:hypothetical protein